MKTLLKLFIFFLLTLGTLTNCSKYGNDNNNNTPPVRYACPQEVKDYCYFKKGTYWIYEDSATKVHDSVWVYSSKFSTDTIYDSQTKKPDAIVDNFESDTKSSYDGYEYNYYYQGYNARLCMKNNPELNNCHTVSISKVGLSNVYGNRWYFFFTIKVGDFGYNNEGKTTVEKYDEVYTLDKSTFTKVYKIYTTKDITRNLWYMNNYISKNVGLIRYESITSKQTWNLIRYNIIQ